MENTYKDYRGYERYTKEHTNAVHRNRIFHVYLENRDKYPHPFSAYEVHHKDFNKNNNKVANLQIVTPTEHDKIHDEEKKRIEEELEKEKEQERKMKEKEMEERGKEMREENRIARENAIKKRYGISSSRLKELIKVVKEEFGISKEELIEDFEEIPWRERTPANIIIWENLIEGYRKSIKKHERKELVKEGIKQGAKYGFKIIKKRKIPEKNKKCISCGRKIRHKGKCLGCNMKAKNERERENLSWKN